MSAPMWDPGPYQRGREHGRRTAEHSPGFAHEHRLRLELALMGKRNRDHRAFALGELRGYRQAVGLPEPIIHAHRILG